MIKVIVVLILLVIILFFICLKLWQKLRSVSFSKRSLSTKYGKTIEQFLPFLPDYPHDSNNFRFIGSPIDGVQFDPDKILFIEFKTAKSQLSEKQKLIKEMIEKKNVEWEEVRIP